MLLWDSTEIKRNKIYLMQLNKSHLFILLIDFFSFPRNGSLVHLHRFSFLQIDFGIEIAEKHDKRNHVYNQSVLHPQWKFTTGTDAIQAQAHCDHELNLLKWTEFVTFFFVGFKT